MRQIGQAAAAGLLALGIVACGPTQEQTAQLLQQQEEILQRLAKLEEGQAKLLEGRPAARRRPSEDYDKVHQIPVASAPIRGNPDAPVTIVEFSDFQCPFCARTAPLIQQVQDKYGDKVRVVYKHFPLNFHPAARPAAIASIAAQEQGKFWEMHDVLFESTASLSPDKMEEYAEKAGLDMDRFRADYEKKKQEYDKRVTAEYQEGVNAAVRGTPTIYINGKKVRERTLPGMSAQIDAELAPEKGS
jgi:protein-disulfide isomerase